MDISDFQAMMKEIYFEKDKKRGIERTYMWLVQEVGELGRALLKKDKGNIEEEFADVLAWLSSLANLLNVNLEAVTVKKYNFICPRCGHNPCICKE